MQDLGEGRYQDDCGYTADMSSCSDLVKTDQEMALALESARRSLFRLTAGQYGACSTTLRPCREDQGCRLPSPGVWNGGTPWHPFLVDGAFINRVCCCDQCSVQGVVVGSAQVIEVKLDGAVLDPMTHYVIVEHKVVSLGDPWPTSQDLTRPSTETGTFEITVRRSTPESLLTERAYGELACEFLKAITGKKCELPSGVRNIVRQGVSMQIEPSLFPGGRTGLRLTDTLIETLNPRGRITPAAIWKAGKGHSS